MVTTVHFSLGVGLAVYNTALSSLRLPSVFSTLASSLLGWLQSSPPPISSQPMVVTFCGQSSGYLLFLIQGATLEIQRTQHAEAVEQQLLRARARQFNVVSV